MSSAKNKYCVIPITKNPGDVGQYFLKFYYACSDKEISFVDSNYKAIMEAEALGEEKIKSTTRIMDISLASTMIRGFMGKGKMAEWTKKVLTPFALDETINPPIAQSIQYIKAARTKNKTSGTLLREYFHDISLRLYDSKLDQEREYVSV